MKLGLLDFSKASDRLDLLAQPVADMITRLGLPDVYVTVIDPKLADTAAFCEQHRIGLDISANCVVVEAKRADKVWYAACMILATDRVDVNGIVRKHFEARKLSFAPMEKATTMTAMEFGGITPIGLPADWPILVDTAVANTEQVIIGSGIRGSKLAIPGQLLGTLPGATIMDIAKKA
jgi:prolyl-tRNA editing enzyme YbaK/EbsC (Cys-tRNA(Pro) deacylase)